MNYSFFNIYINDTLQKQKSIEILKENEKVSEVKNENEILFAKNVTARKINGTICHFQQFLKALLKIGRI